jgi:hypothetical protein
MKLFNEIPINFDRSHRCRSRGSYLTSPEQCSRCSIPPLFRSPLSGLRVISPVTSRISGIDVLYRTRTFCKSIPISLAVRCIRKWGSVPDSQLHEPNSPPGPHSVIPFPFTLLPFFVSILAFEFLSPHTRRILIRQYFGRPSAHPIFPSVIRLVVGLRLLR